jgi:RNA polymerase sigma-70 factor (ECF subfamily)
MEPTYTDAHIIDLYWRRDEQAIHATAGRYGLLCMQTALGILQNRADAEECVSDAYLKVWNAIPPARPRSLGAFIARITRNLALDRYRARMRSKRGGNVTLMLSELSDCIPAPEEEGSAEELLGHIKDFLRERDELDRRLFVGRYFHSYTPRQLAEAHGLKENTLNQRLFRIRERLRKRLAEGGYRV